MRCLIESDEKPLACIRSLALQRHSPQLCAVAGDPVCLQELAVELKDSTICGSDAACLSAIAARLREARLCAVIPERDERRRCIEQSGQPLAIMFTFWFESLILITIVFVSMAVLLPSPPPGAFPGTAWFLGIYLGAALIYYGLPAIHLSPAITSGILGVLLGPIAPLLVLMVAGGLSPLVQTSLAVIAYPAMLLPMAIVWSIGIAQEETWVRAATWIMLLTSTVLSAVYISRTVLSVG